MASCPQQGVRSAAAAAAAKIPSATAVVPPHHQLLVQYHLAAPLTCADNSVQAATHPLAAQPATPANCIFHQAGCPALHAHTFILLSICIHVPHCWHRPCFMIALCIVAQARR